MPSKYNLLAAEFRRFKRRQWEKHGLASSEDDLSWREAADRASLRVHSRCVEVLDCAPHFASEALLRVKQNGLITQRCYDKDRRRIQRANTGRHVWEKPRWCPVRPGTSDVSSTGGSDLSFGYQGELNPDATEFFPAACHDASSMSAPTISSPLLPDFVPSIPRDVPDNLPSLASLAYPLDVDDAEADDFWTRLEKAEFKLAVTSETLDAVAKVEGIHHIRLEAHVANLQSDIQATPALLDHLVDSQVSDAQAAFRNEICDSQQSHCRKVDELLTSLREHVDERTSATRDFSFSKIQEAHQAMSMLVEAARSYVDERVAKMGNRYFEMLNSSRDEVNSFVSQVHAELSCELQTVRKAVNAKVAAPPAIRSPVGWLGALVALEIEVKSLGKAILSLRDLINGLSSTMVSFECSLLAIMPTFMDTDFKLDSLKSAFDKDRVVINDLLLQVVPLQVLAEELPARLDYDTSVDRLQADVAALRNEHVSRDELSGIIQDVAAQTISNVLSATLPNFISNILSAVEPRIKALEERVPS